MKRILVILPLLLLMTGVLGQSKYWVFLTDKQGVTFHPEEYFTPKAIERRKRHHLPLKEWTDYPVKPAYQVQVRQIVDSLLCTSRWLNAIACYATPTQLEQVRQLACVERTQAIRQYSIPLHTSTPTIDQLTENLEQLLQGQKRSLEGYKFQQQGINGQNVRVAVFDAGFPDVDVHPAFSHLHQHNRIVDTKDFVQGDDDVYAHFNHGTMVLSCIAGKSGDTLIGLAPKAEFLLARTERFLWEFKSEEENWVAAMEWADRMGADIINSSLGYVRHRYFTEEMDGQTSLVARAAKMAAHKGILVVNSAGNSGTDSWKIINTPADADSVLTVGGISPWTGYHTSFSSYGPTEDKRLKPNVTSYGHVVAAAPGKEYTQTQGTSFSSPLVAGFAACVLQTHPDWTNMQLLHHIEKSGSLYPYFDYAHGYGVPQASYFFGQQTSPSPTFSLQRSAGKLKVNIKDEYFSPPPDNNEDSQDEEVALQTSAPAHRDYSQIGKERQLLYYHIENTQRYLNKYYVIRVTQQIPLSLYLDNYHAGQTIRVHYKGYTQEYKIQAQ